MSGMMRVYVAMVAAMVFWGMSFIWSKVVFRLYHPLSTIFLRLLLASVVLLLWGWWRGRLQRPGRGDWRPIALMSLFQPCLYFLGENMGLSLVSPTIAAVMVGTIPVFSMLAGVWWRHERLGVFNVVGMAVSFLGVFLVIAGPGMVVQASVPGLLWLFLAVCSAVGYAMTVTRLTGRYNVYSLVTYQNLLGVLGFLPLVLWFSPRDLMVVPDGQVLLALVQLSLLASSLAFMLFTYGMHHLGMGRANAFSNLIPVFTALISSLFFGERLLWFNIVGVTLTVSGLFAVQLRRKESAAPVQSQRGTSR